MISTRTFDGQNMKLLLKSGTEINIDIGSFDSFIFLNTLVTESNKIKNGVIEYSAKGLKFSNSNINLNIEVTKGFNLKNAFGTINHFLNNSSNLKNININSAGIDVVTNTDLNIKFNEMLAYDEVIKKSASIATMIETNDKIKNLTKDIDVDISIEFNFDGKGNIQLNIGDAKIELDALTDAKIDAALDIITINDVKPTINTKVSSNIKFSPLMISIAAVTFAFTFVMIRYILIPPLPTIPEEDFYLKLYGESNIQLPLNNVYEEPGYKAYDKKDGDLTDKVVVSGSVNHKKIGSYILTYTVTNSEKKTITKSRSISVVELDKIIGGESGNIETWKNGNVIEITLDDFNEQIEKGKVYDGIKARTIMLLNDYINKFRLQHSMIYAVSLNSIVKEDNRYASIYNCNNNYLNTEASGMIVTNGTLERVYNKNNICFNNYGLFYFTKNQLHHTKVTNETINTQIINSKTRNTFVYQDVIVDNGMIVNNSTVTTTNYGLCQSGSNTLKLFIPDKEISYGDLGNTMINNKCQTGLLLTDGSALIYKSQYSSTLNVNKGSDIDTDSIMFIYEKIKK